MSKTALTLRRPDDLRTLGDFVRRARHAAGFASAKAAAPLLGVTPRLLAEVERGMRTTRGIAAGSLLTLLSGLGYELVVRKRTFPDRLPSEEE